MRSALVMAAALSAACKPDAPLAALPSSGPLAAALPGSGTGPAGGAGGGAAGSERVAELYLSTEVSGYIEPCGCTSTPLGGIQRLATVLQRGRPARALLDAGDLLFPTEPMTETTREQHVLKARILARMYRQLGAVALNVGPSDLAAGAAFLEELQREGSVPLLSTNVRPTPADRGPAIAQSFLREIGGIRVGVLGVARPEAFIGVKALIALEYAPAVRNEQKLLRDRGAEIVVVLAHVGDQGAEELAREVPDVDVIVRAPGTPIGTPPAAPKQIGAVTIVEAGSQGQHIGRLTLRFGAAKPARPIVLDGAGAQGEARRTRDTQKLRAYRTEVEAWSADPSKAEVVAKKRAQIAELERDLAATPVAGTGAQPVPSIRFELVPLTEQVPSDANATEVLETYYSTLKNLNLAKGDVTLCATPDGHARYVGTDACKGCHPEAYALWRTTKHGKAWATLESQNKHFDLTCIGCHTVGYQKAGGFCRLSDVGVLKDVGCENCHGPGSLHLATGDKTRIVRAVTEATCAAGCHVPEHSDTFAFSTYLPRILGPGHQAKKAAP